MNDAVGRADAAQDHRNVFERFVEAVSQVVSRATFFTIMIVVLVAWAVSLPLWSSVTKWELALHTGAAIISLLLLVVLENSGRRGEEAMQEKLNVLAEALSDLMASRSADDPSLEESVAKLREAVGLEERH